MTTASLPAEAVHREMWTSFISLLRSYTAAHGLNGRDQAILDVGAETLLIRVADRTLRITHTGDEGVWQRENGIPTRFRLDEHGRIVVDGHAEEMDMVAERLAREIMQ